MGRHRTRVSLRRPSRAHINPRCLRRQQRHRFLSVTAGSPRFVLLPYYLSAPSLMIFPSAIRSLCLFFSLLWFRSVSLIDFGGGEPCPIGRPLLSPLWLSALDVNCKPSSFESQSGVGLRSPQSKFQKLRFRFFFLTAGAGI
jgi:hypothetical protein